MMRCDGRSLSRRAPWLIALFFGLAGCSSDGGSAADSGTDSITDSVIDAPAVDQGVEGPLTVMVKIFADAWTGGFDQTPASGATVVAEQANGWREEQTTGADGKVTFAAVNWSGGPITLTGYLKTIACTASSAS